MPTTLDDVFRTLRYLGRAAAGAGDVNAAASVAREIGHFGGNQIGRGWSGQLLTRTVSELNDMIVRRVIELTAAEHRLPPVPWCWLALGSEGRFEQTFITDQDNGLIFSATGPQEADALRELFLGFAQKVNRHLDHCGFSLCPGLMMAGNPKWCLSLEEWRDCFTDWVRKPAPLALMHSTIFFDLRPLYGDFSLARKLQSDLLLMTPDAPAFLHLMAANALQVEPALSFRGELAAHDEKGIDLKKNGVRLFVDAARIFALAAGVGEVETRQRLSLSGAHAGLQPEVVASAIASVSEIQRLRLEHQVATIRAGGIPDNHVQPEHLNEFDRAVLREAMRQVKHLQQRLKLNYGLQ